MKYSIQERVALQDMFSVIEAQNKAMKIERLHNRDLPFKGAAERTFDNIRTQQSFTSSERPLARKVIDTPPANPMTVAAHYKGQGESICQTWVWQVLQV